MEEYGVENIKKAFGLLIDLGMAAEDHLSDDGKIKLREVLDTLAAEAFDIVDVVRGAGQLKLELGEWSPEERTEVLAFVVARLDLDDDKAEAIIEKFLELIKLIGEVIGLIKE